MGENRALFSWVGSPCSTYGIQLAIPGMVYIYNDPSGQNRPRIVYSKGENTPTTKQSRRENIPHNRETKGSFEFKSYGLEMAYLAVHGQNRPPDGQNSPLGFCTNPPGQKMSLAIIIALDLSGNTMAPVTLTKDA